MKGRCDIPSDIRGAPPTIPVGGYITVKENLSNDERVDTHWAESMTRILGQRCRVLELRLEGYRIQDPIQKWDAWYVSTICTQEYSGNKDEEEL